MSFPRLRKSSSYPIILDIYNKVHDNIFYSKQVGLDHKDISLLKINGYIINVKTSAEKKQTMTICSTNNTIYKVKLYRLSQRCIDIIEEDLREKEEIIEQ